MLAAAKSKDLPPRDLVAQLVARLDPERIYLFGSRAEGRARVDSDYDLLVVLPDDTPEERLSLDYAYEAKCGFGIAADIIPCTVAEFETGKDEPGNLCRMAHQRGILVYDRAA